MPGWDSPAKSERAILCDEQPDGPRTIAIRKSSLLCKLIRRLSGPGRARCITSCMLFQVPYEQLVEEGGLAGAVSGENGS